MHNTKKIIFCITLVTSLVFQLEAVTINQTLCPTNKIAPNRRAASWEPNRPRTLGLIYSLLSPSRPRPPPLNYQDELQQQEDDPDDCGDIEDYDETDLSSITPGANNKVLNDRGSRLFFGYNHLNQPSRPPQRPFTPRPQRPTYPPIKPPYNSGGIFGSNVYRPQNPQYPSNHIKPVHEYTNEYPQADYVPGVVGGAIGSVVGYQPVRPTFPERPNTNIRFPDNDAEYTKRPVRTGQTNVATGIIGSFVDLIFN